MATITVYKFDTPEGAGQMLDLVQDLEKGQLINVEDGALITWPPGKKKPKTKHLGDMTGEGALGGAFWGMLFGLIFFVPLFGMAVGAAMGALVGKFSDYGIDKDFINQVGQKVTEDTSALCLMTSDAVVDKVSNAIKEKGWEFEIVTSNLSEEQEGQLREDFGAA
jgi:uncharacterized membrane protein